MITFVLKEQLSNNSYGRLYPLTHTLPAVQEIYDPQTKSRRIIRCCRGEKSIFQDEQNPNSEVRRIVFKNGIFLVDERETQLLNFLEVCDWNYSNESRDQRVKAIFYRLDKEDDAREENKYLDISFEAESIARGMSIDEMLDFCRSARIKIDRSIEEIKYDVFHTARSNPDYFLDVYNDPVMKRLSVIRKAEEEGVLFFDNSKRQVYLVEGSDKSSVKVVPLGVDMQKHFSEWTFENEGKEVFSHIEKLLNKEKSTPVRRGRKPTTKTE